MENSIGYKLLMIILFFLPDRFFAQTPVFRYSQQTNQDSLFMSDSRDTLTRKRFYRASGLLFVSNLIPWIYDRHIANDEFARVNINTIRYNLNPGHWAWDSDKFITNQFSHPLHGSIAFNTFRSNGYNFWQSVPASFAGSYIWETFGERQAPSINDFVNSSLGGITIGEMAHRISNKLVNNRSIGIKRQVNEVLALLLNPINGFNRIVDGKWGAPTSGIKIDSSKIYTEIDMGLRKYNGTNLSGNTGWSGRLKLSYGSPFEKYSIPFSYLTLNTEFGLNDINEVSLINISGAIAGWSFSTTERSRHSGRLTVNYDYHSLQDFYYGAQSFNFNLYSNFNYSGKFPINTIIGAGPILLAALPDPYIYNERSYGYCSGAGLTLAGDINFNKFLSCRFNYKGGWFKTWNGNGSDYSLNMLTTELGFSLNHHLSICAEPGFFFLNGNFKVQSDIKRAYKYLRFAVRYGINR